MTIDAVLEALRRVIDPEMGVNIVDLGLVYDVSVDDRFVDIEMTMTTPACPLYKYLTQQAELEVRRAFPRLQAVTIVLVWKPEWNPMMMSWNARALLGSY